MATQIQDEDDAITGINVTPLVDITLVLLIIFMVTATYIVKQTIEVELPRDRARAVAWECQHSQRSRYRPAREIGRALDRLGVVAVWVEQQRGEPAPAALALPRLIGLDPQVALDHVIGELVRVDEDLFGQRDHDRRGDPRLVPELGGAPPCCAHPRAERRSQRIEATPRLELDLAEPPPGLASRGSRPLVTFDCVEKRVDRLLDPEPDPDPLGTAEHLGVDRILGSDGGNDLLDQPVRHWSNGPRGAPTHLS